MKGEVPTDPDTPIGKADIKESKRYNSNLDVCLESGLACSRTIEEGVEVDLRTLVDAVIQSVKKLQKVLLVNDTHKTSGSLVKLLP